MLRFDAANVPVSSHTADQLVLLLAMAGGGRFRTVTPTPHLTSQMETIGRFLEVDVRIEKDATGAHFVEVARR